MGKQPLTKKHWNLPKKIPYIQRQRRNNNKTVGGAQSQQNQIPYPRGAWPTNWKTVTPQKFSYRSESPEPHVRLPSLEVQQQEEEPQRIWLWRPAGFDHRNSTGLGKAETPLLEGWHKIVCAPEPRGKKQWPHKRLGPNYLLVIEGLLQRCGVAVAHCGDKDTGSRSVEYSLVWALPEAAISPTLQPVGTSAGTPLAMQPTGWEHSSTHQQTSC